MRRRRYDLAQALYCKACILQEERRIGAGYVFKPKCFRTHFNLNDPADTPYKIRRAVKESDLALQQTCERLKPDFGVKITPLHQVRFITMQFLLSNKEYTSA